MDALLPLPVAENALSAAPVLLQIVIARTLLPVARSKHGFPLTSVCSIRLSSSARPRVLD